MLLKVLLLFFISSFSNVFATGHNHPYTYNGLEGKILNQSNIPTNNLRVVVRICNWQWYRKCRLKKVKSKIAKDGSFKLKSKTAYKSGDELYITHYILDKKTKKRYQMERKLSGRVKNLPYTNMNYTLTENLEVLKITDRDLFYY